MSKGRLIQNPAIEKGRSTAERVTLVHRGISTIVQKGKRAFQILQIVRNFPSVYGRLILGLPLQRLLLRNGVVIKSGKGVDLWRNFHDIWIHQIYTDPLHPIRSGAIVIDVGASIGLFSLLAASQDANVLVYEPDPEVFQILLENIRMNPATQIRARQCALGSRNETRVLYRFGESAGNSFFFRPGKEPSLSAPEATVECFSLAEIFEIDSIGHCDLMKMNCEGAEFEILLGTPRTLFERIQAIVFECHDRLTPYPCDDLVCFLENMGYRVRISLQRQDGTALFWARQGGSRESSGDLSEEDTEPGVR